MSKATPANSNTRQTLPTKGQGLEPTKKDLIMIFKAMETSSVKVKPDYAAIAVAGSKRGANRDDAFQSTDHVAKKARTRKNPASKTAEYTVVDDADNAVATTEAEGEIKIKDEVKEEFPEGENLYDS